MRKGITYLQSCGRLRQGAKLEKQDVYEIAGVIDDGIIEGLLKACRANSYEKLETHVQVCVSSVYGILDISKYL